MNLNEGGRSWPRAKLRWNKEIQKLASLHEMVQLIRMEADFNSKIQIPGSAATVGKRYLGLCKDLVLIVGKVREYSRERYFGLYKDLIVIVGKVTENS